MADDHILFFQVTRSPMSSVAASFAFPDYQLRFLFLDDFTGPVTLTTTPS
jgi:hypothetical protein